MIVLRPRLLIALAITALPPGCDRPATSVAGPPGQQPQQSQSPRIVDCTFDDFEFEMAENATFDRSMLTPKVEEYFGKRIRIRGFMFPTLTKKGVKSFVFIRDNQECCFGPGAKLFHNIMVKMQPGRTAEYTTRPITVEGVFRFQVEKFDDLVVSIYRLDGETVE
ncbi:MAG: DUF3299 domain-containing protein [Pirellulales bacterium]|nr:DUF3299 domain-containing protein [Pirellulales bacterium]